MKYFLLHLIMFVCVFNKITSINDTTTWLIKCSKDADCKSLTSSKCIKKNCQCTGPGSNECLEINNLQQKVASLTCKIQENCMYPNSRCDVTQFCACKEGFIALNNNSECVKIVKFGQKCQSNVQCYAATNNTECRGNTCVCQPYFDEEDEQCVKFRKKKDNFTIIIFIPMIIVLIPSLVFAYLYYKKTTKMENYFESRVRLNT